MAELKTKKTLASVSTFIAGIRNETRRRDSKAVVKLMKKLTGASPKMWGSSIVGFGSYRYQYASGHSGEWPVTGFSPRKDSLSIYLMCGMATSKALLKKLGPYKNGKSCLYIKDLADVDMKILEQLIKKSIVATKKAESR